MNIEHEVINCKVCNRKRELIDHELINLVIHKEGDDIGNCQTVPAVNLRLFCQNCKTNTSEPYPYNNPDVIPRFIEDVKKHSARFENKEYITI